MSNYFDNDNLNNYISKMFSSSNNINLSEIYKYLDDNIKVNDNIVDKNGKIKIIYEEIYKKLRYVKNQFYKTNRIEVNYENDFQFLCFDSKLLENYLEFFNFNGNFIINGFSSETLRISKLKISGYFYIINHSIQSLIIKESEILQGININDVNQLIQLENIKFNTLEIDGNNTKELILSWNIDFSHDIGEVTLKNFINIEDFFLITNNVNTIEKIKLSNSKFIKNNNHFQIADLNVKELIINEGFNSSESLVFSRINIQNKLIIKNSNLGKAVFNGVEIGELEIENATLNDCIFNGVDFGNNYKLSDNNGKISTKVLKDNYRQLKHVMDKNANYTEANNFYALEMEYYGKSLKLLSKDVFNKIIHISQFITSNFGNSWTLCLFWILFIAGISDIINYFYVFKNYNALIDWKLNFIDLLSPFYGLNSNILNEIKSDLYLYSGFILYKIIYGILIYQLIIALKRTTRR